MENKKQLEILVVEDKEVNQKSISQLEKEGHNVDIATTFAEAVEYLGHGKREGKQYDVVLTDMMFPYGERDYESGLPAFTREGERERYDENPLGYAIVLHAARKNVPLIGILTDMNHHAGPIAGTFDLFYTEDYGRPIITINDSRLMMFDQRDLPGLYILKNGCMTEEYPDDDPEETTKNWKAALTKLITGDETGPD